MFPVRSQYSKIDFFNEPNSSSNHCGSHNITNSKNSKDSSKKTTSIHSFPDCKIVLEDISTCKGALKHNALKLCQDKTHMTHSCYSTDINILLNLESKIPIAWHRLNDERWEILDSAVYQNSTKVTTYMTVWSF